MSVPMNTAVMRLSTVARAAMLAAYARKPVEGSMSPLTSTGRARLNSAVDTGCACVRNNDWRCAELGLHNSIWQHLLRDGRSASNAEPPSECPIDAPDDRLFIAGFSDSGAAVFDPEQPFEAGCASDRFWAVYNLRHFAFPNVASS